MKNKIIFLLGKWMFFFLLIGLHSCNKNFDSNISQGKVELRVASEIASFSEEKTILNNKSNIQNEPIEDILDTTIALNNDLLLKAALVYETSDLTGLNSGIIQKSGNRASTKPVDNNVWYRVIVFDKNTGSYVTERLYQRNRESDVSVSPVLILNGGIEYTFVAYSVNSSIASDLPLLGGPISGKTLTNSFINISGSNTDFMFAKVDKIISGEANDYLGIVFERKTNLLTISIDATATGYNVEAVTSKLLAKSSSAQVFLSNGALNRSPDNADVLLSFSSLGSPVATSSPLVVNTGPITGTDNFLSISKLEIGGVVVNSLMTFFKNISLTPGGKYNLKLTIVPNDQLIDNYGGLGYNAVRINGAVWMRNNLRSDGNYSSTPDVPGVNIFGNYYQWGRKNPVSNEVNLNINSAVPNWTTRANSYAFSWNGNPSTNIATRENAPIKASDSSNPGAYGNTGDPCPIGYRIPTKKEFDELINGSYTKHSFQGNLTNESFTGAGVLTSRRNSNARLTFPAQGTLFAVEGNNAYAGISNRGLTARIWTSYFINSPTYQVSHFHMNSTSNVTDVTVRIPNANNTSIGIPIRCIAVNSSL